MVVLAILAHQFLFAKRMIFMCIYIIINRKLKKMIGNFFTKLNHSILLEEINVITLI